MKIKTIQFATLIVLLTGSIGGPFAASVPTNASQATSATHPLQHANFSVVAPDAFYDPPASVPSPAGALLRSEPLRDDVVLPAGMRGWRILYTTTINDSTPTTAVANVFAPINPPAGPRPVITWEHGTTGVLQKCMPSLQRPPTVGIPALDQVAQAGWVIVATDYPSAGKGGPIPYLVGEAEARAGLDSVRAARQMPELTLDTRTVIWGHSQGGQSALWTGIVGPRYAPDVQIVGVAAIAPAANIKGILATNASIGKALGPYIALAYSSFYPDISFDNAVPPEALTAARKMANLCSFLPSEDPKQIQALAASFEGPSLAMATNAALAARVSQNTPDSLIMAPLLIAQGLADTVVPASVTNPYVDDRCAAGQRLDYWTFAGIGHSEIVEPGKPLDEPLVAWTKSRFANEPQASGCVRKSF